MIVMSATPKRSWPWGKTAPQTVFGEPDKESVHAQFDRVLDTLELKLPKSFAHLEASDTAGHRAGCDEPSAHAIAARQRVRISASP